MVEDDHGAGGPGGARWRDLTPPPASPNIILSRPSHLAVNKSRNKQSDFPLTANTSIT